MALTKEHRNRITETIKICLRDKFQNYMPETENMPFHYRLLGKDRMALYSFLHSLTTSFGTSIYEPVAKELAKPIFKEASTQYKLENIITQDAQNEIQKIMNDLSIGGETNSPTKEAKPLRQAPAGPKRAK